MKSFRQNYSVLRNYGISSLSFADPVRLGNHTYRVWGENRTENPKLNASAFRSLTNLGVEIMEFLADAAPIVILFDAGASIFANPTAK